MLKKLVDVLKAFPIPIEDEYYSRELASFYRSDLILFCSDYEQMKVEEKFGIKQSGLITFFYSKEDIDNSHQFGFAKRENFVWIGNF